MGNFKYFSGKFVALVLATCLPISVLAKFDVQLSFTQNLLPASTDGRVVVLFAPRGTDPLEDTDVTSTPDLIFGKNVYRVTDKDTVTLSSGGDHSIRVGVYGFPNASLADITPGSYSVQAFLNPYEKVKRSDGSSLSVHFPCGDGAPNINGVGSLVSPVVDLDVQGVDQTIELQFNNVTTAEAFTGKETGGCSQGNYQDTETLKYVKIRSKALSDFWGRDMYVGANVVLPSGYQANDTSKRYPTIYSQGHWPADGGAFNYPRAKFSSAWDSGVIPGTNTSAPRSTPKLILVTFRHEAPFYDDSYAVNTANIGPYGDAINDELIPYLESIFNMIPEPYARIQEGGSTGGWISAASVIFRPDLFGACFSSYPDSLDFHKHQDISLYTSANAYTRADGSAVPSIREFVNDTEHVLATVAQENHWELSFGTASRSSLQWDVWNAVFGAQGLNGYPLEPWNKVTGEIYPEAVEYWKPFDLGNYIVSNWANERNLGQALRNRVFVYVGTHDDYYLNEGVMEFQKTVEAVSGPNWVNVTILEGKPHGGIYQTREIWNYLEFLETWVNDHSPQGATPLSDSVTKASSRGNTFAEVINRAGYQAALARQAPPVITAKDGSYEATVGRWDPGMELEAQWFVNGKPCSEVIAVRKDTVLNYEPDQSSRRSFLQLQVVGRKPNYSKETRESNKVAITR